MQRSSISAHYTKGLRIFITTNVIVRIAKKWQITPCCFLIKTKGYFNAF